MPHQLLHDARVTASAVVVIAGVSMFVLLAARSHIEEQRLIEKFGKDYGAYRRSTGRFVPRLRRKGWPVP